MTNNLKDLKKELKSFAKRVKDFKYTDSALISFLLTGAVGTGGLSFNLFSAEDEIKEQTKQINTSIVQLRQDFKKARTENKKLLRNTNLELIQLMEQGDHVVKSPWSSWQYGINGMYNNWQGHYKGRGDKTADVKYERDKTMGKYKYNTTPNTHTLYGNTTELGLKREPNAMIPVSASLTPLVPKIKQTNLSLGVDISDLPSFEPRTISAPKAPKITPLDGVNAPAFKLIAESLANGDERYYDNTGGGGGVVEAVAMLGGNFITERTGNAGGLQGSDYTFGDRYRDYSLWNYSYTDYDVSNPFSNTVTSDGHPSNPLLHGGRLSGLSRSNATTGAKSGFIRMVSDGGGANGSSTMLTNANIIYARKNTATGTTSDDSKYGGKIKEIVHLDTHMAQSISGDKIRLDNKALSYLDPVIKNKINTAWTDFANIAAAKGIINSQTFVNSGTVVIEGSKTAFSNSYDHIGGGYTPQKMATVINTGNIIIHPMLVGSNELNSDSAVFVVSSEVYTGSSGLPQLLYNSGNIDVYNKNSSVFFINPNPYERKGNTIARRDITLVNRAGNIKLYGDTSVGVYIKTPNYVKQLNLDFSDSQNSSGKFSPITLYGDNSIGMYIEKIDNADDTSTGTITSIKRESDSGNSAVVGNFAVNIGDPNDTGNQKYKSENQISITSSSSAISGATIDKKLTEGTPHEFELNDSKPIISRSYGIFSNYNIDLSTAGTSTGITKKGHEINIYGNTQKSIGVLTGNNAKLELGAGSINLIRGTDNIGIVTGGDGTSKTAGKVIGDIVTLEGAVDNSDKGNRAIYTNKQGNSVEVNAVKSTNATNSVALVADDHSKITVNKATPTGKTSLVDTASLGFKNGVTISGAKFVYDKLRTVSATDLTSSDSVGAAYANNHSNITMNRAVLPLASDGANISIIGDIDKVTKQYVGFGLFADDNSTINAENNWLKVKNGSTNIASLKNSIVNLKGSTVEYDGEGYALYTDNTSNNTGAINMTNGKLILDGKAVGYVRDLNKPNAITFNNTDIEINSDEVIVSDLKKTGGIVDVKVENKTTPGDSLRDQLLGTGLNPVTSKTGATRYKYAVVDNANIYIKSDIEKSNTKVDTDSDVFTRRFLYQNSRIDVDNGVNVKAELDTALLQGIDKTLTVPVGLAVSASGNSKNTTTTGINNNGIVSVDRTDGTDKGGIGLYVNYGYLNNKVTGIVNVEKGTVNGPNKQGIGIYGTNSTNIINEGKVNAGGEKSIGILGLSYRIDPSTGLPIDPVNEPYKAATTSFGIVNVTNETTGEITMDNDAAVGIFIKNNSIDKDLSGNYAVAVPNRKTKLDTKAVNKGKVTINGSNNSVAMGANNGIITNDTTGKITVNGTKSAGMYGTNESDLINNGEINVAATSAKNESIGMYIDDQKSTITNTGKINVGKSSYGIFGKKVDMTSGEINVDDNGVGVYSTGPAVSLTGGKINVANNNAVGVYIADDATNPQPTTVTGNVDMKVGDTDSFGYLITAKNAKTDLTTHAPNDVHIGEKSVYIYSGAPKALGGKIENYSNIVTDKNNGYGIYSSQDSINYGNIDLRSGDGNIGIYSTQGVGKNYGTITVGTSNIANKQYGIGMATGYYDETKKATSNVGTIENYGTINVSQENSVGMYAVGKGSTAINRGTINLDGKNTTGMYIDRDAVGENYGVIQTTPTANGTGIKGVVVTNGGIIKNYGTINVAGNKNMGVYVYKGSDGAATYEEYGSNTSTRPFIEGTATDQKVTGSAVVKVPPASLPSAVSISVNGVEVTPVKVNTSVPEPKAPEVTITDLTGVTTLNLATEQMDHEHTHSNAEISSLGMYVDTSGINYTKPIQGLSNLYGLTDIDLIMGTEVTKYLNAKAIQIGDNILKPYNDALAGVVSSGVTLNVNSASLTWIAQPVESGNISAPIKTVYMVKIPYTDFASENDTDTAHFLDGLEQRYGVEDIHSREKQIFNKLNSLGKGENHIFAQAVNEMKGYEYSNTQMRINSTGNALDKEFKYLHDEWRNPSKQNNKIKVFGQKDEFNTDTAGVIDYDSNAYGVAYVHEDEAVTLGNSTGWYAGAVSNRFKFKDLGKSTEQQSMIKAGLFKTMSPVKDHNGNLRWTIAGDVFGGVNNMHRKFWVVDDVFESKADYYSYGAALKTDLGYDIRLSERTHLRPYGALKMEYGRFSSVKEDRGQMNLEVKGNDYFSVKPEVGAEFKYVQPLAVRTQLSVGLSAAYENELGKLNRLNQARVRYTTADWYNLRNEKEDRHGNGKFDLNLGIDNTRFGVTVNAGYDTKGENIRGGLGFRLIY